MSGTRMTEPWVTRNCLSPDLMIAYATAVTSNEKTRGSKLRIIGAVRGPVNSAPLHARGRVGYGSGNSFERTAHPMSSPRELTHPSRPPASAAAQVIAPHRGWLFSLRFPGDGEAAFRAHYFDAFRSRM